MSLALWDPFREMEDLLDKYRKSVRRTNLLAAPDEANFEVGDWMPPVEIQETPEQFIIKVELPGVEKDDVSLHINNGALVIRGEKKSEKEDKDSKVHRFECSYGSFVRSFSLPRGVKSDKIPDAEFKDGILKLILPKSEEAKPKQIDIKIK